MAGNNTSRITDHSVPITAADVRRFHNPDELRASSALIEDDIISTLHRAACVLDFLSGCKDYGDSAGAGSDAQYGFHIVLKFVRDGLEKQAEALSPNRAETSDV